MSTLGSVGRPFRRHSASFALGHSALTKAMLVVFLLIFISLTLALAFLTAFIWAVKSGQFEDTCTPSMRILTDEESSKTNLKRALTKPNT